MFCELVFLNFFYISFLTLNLTVCPALFINRLPLTRIPLKSSENTGKAEAMSTKKITWARAILCDECQVVRYSFLVSSYYSLNILDFDNVLLHEQWETWYTKGSQRHNWWSHELLWRFLTQTIIVILPITARVYVAIVILSASQQHR